MKNLLAEKKLTMAQIALVVWIVFSAIYVVQDLWRDGVAAAYKAGQQSGAQIAEGNMLNGLIQESQKCQPIAIGQSGVSVIAVQCLQQQEVAEGETTEAVQ